MKIYKRKTKVSGIVEILYNRYKYIEEIEKYKRNSEIIWKEV